MTVVMCVKHITTVANFENHLFIMKSIRLILILISLVFNVSVQAQDNKNTRGQSSWNRKSVVKEMKQHIKAKAYSKADEVFQNQYKQYPHEMRHDTRIMALEVDVQRNLALEQNRNIYLNNKPDTAKYFQHIYQMYQYAFICDSSDLQPDSKGRVKPTYRESNASKLLSFRNNLRSAGKFHYNKKNYSEAYRFISLYLDSHQSALLHASTNTSWKDEDTVQIATLACLSAFADSQFQQSVKYLPLAMQDQSNRKYVLEISSKAFSQLNDTASMLRQLETGIEEYPEYDYFILTIIKHYNERKEYGHALSHCKKLLNLYPDSRTLWFVKGKEEQYMMLNDSAKYSFMKVIDINPQDAEAYSNLGHLALSDAKNFYTRLKPSELTGTKKKKLQTIYQTACDYFECSKKFAPDNPSLWYEPLRDVYYHLNRGKDLKNLERQHASE